MKFFTIKEIAEMSGKSQKTIRRHIAAGLLKYDKVSNKYRIYENDFNEWMEKAPELEEIAVDIEKDIEFGIKKMDDVNYIDISDIWGKNFWVNENDGNGYTFIDLFAGAGGLSLGFVEAGFTPVASVEINEFAVETYKHNFIEKRGFDEFVESRDIREKEVKQYLYQHLKGKKVDVICGGFPCQGFSMSGNRIVTDDRNSLYKEMLEIVEEIKPDFVVMENVVGLRTMLDGKIEAKIIQDYNNAGYDVNVTVLSAADYFVPQMRQRVIFICNRIGAVNYHPKPLLKKENYLTIKDAIEDLMDIPDDKNINHIRTKHRSDMIERLENVEEGKSLYENYSDSWKKSHWEKPSCTIKENHGAVNIHPRRPRVITAREMARLQSFPDDFIFKGAKKWQLVQLGNAVPPLLGKAIALAVEKSLKNR
ncbi:MAG: DNA cytosine methyltransferase [Clostridium sp.]